MWTLTASALVRARAGAASGLKKAQEYEVSHERLGLPGNAWYAVRFRRSLSEWCLAARPADEAPVEQGRLAAAPRARARAERPEAAAAVSAGPELRPVADWRACSGSCCAPALTAPERIPRVKGLATDGDPKPHQPTVCRGQASACARQSLRASQIRRKTAESGAPPASLTVAAELLCVPGSFRTDEPQETS